MAVMNDIINIMQFMAPESMVYPKDHDNIGLLVGDKNANVTKILCCLDVSNYVIQQAINEQAQLIISHHPVIFYPISRITANDVLGKNLIALIKNGISVYSSHTNLDFCKNGINQYAAESMGLSDIKPLDPYISPTEGLGRIGLLKTQKTANEFCGELKQIFNDPHIKVIGRSKIIKKAAIINGGGGGDTRYIDMACDAGADCFITGDIKHHVALYALEKNLSLIELSHFLCEHHYIPYLTQLLNEELKKQDLDVKVITAQEINPYSA